MYYSELFIEDLRIETRRVFYNYQNSNFDEFHI